MKFLRSIGDCWIHGIVLICALQIASKDPNRHRFVRVTTPIGLHETSRLVVHLAVPQPPQQHQRHISRTPSHSDSKFSAVMSQWKQSVAR